MWKTLTVIYDVVNKDTGSYGGVETADLAIHRKFDDEVALFSDEPGHAFAFRTDDQYRIHIVLEIGVVLLCLTGTADDPVAVLLEFLDRVDQIVYFGDLHIFKGTAGDFGNSIIHLNGIMALIDDAIDTGTLAGPDDGAKIMDVLYPVEHHDQTVSVFNHLRNLGHPEFFYFRHIALMVTGLAELVEQFAVTDLIRDTLVFNILVTQYIGLDDPLVVQSFKERILAENIFTHCIFLLQILY